VKWVNQYSMLWSALFILLILAFFMLRKGFTSKNGVKILLAGALLVFGWFFLRPEQTNTEKYVQFQSKLGQGQAVDVVEVIILVPI